MGQLWLRSNVVHSFTASRTKSESHQEACTQHNCPAEHGKHAHDTH